MRHVTACLAVSATLAVAGLGAVQPARAADDMGSSPVQELMSAIGLGDKEKPEIDYRERPALVPPPSTMQLPPPQQKGAVGQATGQWPLDPDEERRARKRAEADIPKTETREYKMERSPVLPPSEIIGRRVANPNTVGDYSPASSNEPVRLSPSELRGHGRAAVAASSPATEPTRARLTDPPPGYRAPTGAVEPPAPAPASNWYNRLNPFASR